MPNRNSKAGTNADSDMQPIVLPSASIEASPVLAAVVSDATHLLWCRHCIGRQCKEYLMACIPLGLSKGGKMKVLVFGNRNWKGYDHIKNIRYVEPGRVIVNGG